MSHEKKRAKISQSMEAGYWAPPLIRPINFSDRVFSILQMCDDYGGSVWYKCQSAIIRSMGLTATCKSRVPRLISDSPWCHTSPQLISSAFIKNHQNTEALWQFLNKLHIIWYFTCQVSLIFFQEKCFFILMVSIFATGVLAS